MVGQVCFFVNMMNLDRWVMMDNKIYFTAASKMISYVQDINPFLEYPKINNKIKSKIIFKSCWLKDLKALR